MFLALLLYFALVSIISIFIKDRTAKLLVIFGLLAGVLIDGLRVDTGTDWIPYADHFESIGRSVGDHFEIGYEYLTFWSKHVFESYTVFLLIHAIAVYFGIYYTVFRLSGYRPIAVMLLYASLYAVLGSNRQLLALVFFSLSIQFIFSRQFFIFTALILGGALFHRTILLVWPIYFLFGLKARKIAVGFGALIGVGYFAAERIDSIIGILINQNLVDLSRYAYYISEPVGDTRPILALSKKLFAILIPIAIVGRPRRCFRDERFVFVTVCAAATIPLYIIGELGLPIFNSRFDIYFGYIFYPVFAAMCQRMARRGDQKLSLALFFIFIAMIAFWQNPMYDLFSPYKSIFYNIEFVRNLY